MLMRAVRTGLAAFFAVSLGTALGMTASPSASWIGWLLAVIYAGCGATIMLSISPDPERPATNPPRRVSLSNMGAAVAGLTALGSLWWLERVWAAFVIGAVAVIGLTLSAASLVAPSPHPDDPNARTIPVRRPVILGVSLQTLFLAVVFPLVGFLGAGGSLVGYPWRVSAVLLVPTLAFELAIHPRRFETTDSASEARRYRFRSLGMAALMVFGVILSGRLFPASSELRLLAISPAMVVAVVALAAPLYPVAKAGHHLAETLVAISYFMVIAALSLVSLFS